MRHLLVILIVGLLCCGSAVSAMAGLTWTEELVSFTAAITDEKAEATFTFTNAGELPVTITSIKTSCGCTTARLDKLTYIPGEKGEIAVAFEFGDRVGAQHNYITVTTSEPGEDTETVVREMNLYLNVLIPDPVRVRPRMVFWRQGEERKPKAVQLILDKRYPVKLSQAGIEGGAVEAELMPPDEGGHVRLVLTPRDTPISPVDNPEASQSNVEQRDVPPTEVSRLSIVTLQAAIEDGPTRLYKIYARVEAGTVAAAVDEDQSAEQPRQNEMQLVPAHSVDTP